MKGHAQSCWTLWDPVDCSPQGSSVHGILQARILKSVAMPISRGIFPTQGWNPGSPALQAHTLSAEPPGKPRYIFFLMFSLQVVSDSLWPHGLQHARPPCPSSSPRVCPSPCALNQWCIYALKHWKKTKKSWWLLLVSKEQEGHFIFAYLYSWFSAMHIY